MFLRHSNVTQFITKNRGSNHRRQNRTVHGLAMDWTEEEKHEKYFYEAVRQSVVRIYISFLF